ncbi:MAG: DUF2330 domain-containing protein [Phycisphaerales bacterium]|nr:DUF2330 domain-containing protein [Phycisphaerales bacterium]
MLVDQRQALLQQLATLRDRRFAIRRGVAEAITTQLAGRIRVGVRQSGDVQQYADLLTVALRNAHVRTNTVVPKLVQAFWPDRLAAAVRAGDPRPLVEEAELSSDQARKVLDALGGSETLFQLECVDLGDMPTIELNDNGEYKPSPALSTGQKCTAVLPILLLDSANPLLIDQPEDNLDNRFIFEHVVGSLCAAKVSRQLVFVTHNPNIPVLGDAERVFALDSDGTRAFVARTGGVDDCRHEILTLLEGGAEAFAHRFFVGLLGRGQLAVFGGHAVLLRLTILGTDQSTRGRHACCRPRRGSPGPGGNLCVGSGVEYAGDQNGGSAMRRVNCIRAVAICGALLGTLAAQADRGSAPFKPYVQIFEPTQRALIAWNGEEEILLLTTDLRASEPTKVLEVLPLPSEPKVGKGDIEVFGKATELINRKLAERERLAADAWRSQTALLPKPAGEVTFAERIGQHDIRVVKVNDADGFVEWVSAYLRKAGVENPKIPEPLQQAIGEYLKDGYAWFVFDVVELGTDVKTNEAIQYRFKTPALYYPMRISRTDAGETSVELLVLTPRMLTKFAGLPMEQVKLRHEPIAITDEELAELNPELSALLGCRGEHKLRIWEIRGRLDSFTADVLAE